jgi:hypothetical protein
VDPRFHRAAQSVAAEYADAGATAVLLAGSVSRGVADRFSDVELGVFWPEEPPARYVDFDRVGIPFETVHISMANAERDVGPTLEDLSFAAALVDGKALHGAELLSSWRERLLPYPDELAAAVVRAHGQIDNLWQLEVHAARKNALLLHARVVEACQSVLHALLAANRVYWFGFKRIDEIEARLTLAPADLAARIGEAPRNPELVLPLAEEAYDIVERTTPGVDVNWLREVLRYRRPAQHASPASGPSP